MSTESRQLWREVWEEIENPRSQRPRSTSPIQAQRTKLRAVTYNARDKVAYATARIAAIRDYIEAGMPPHLRMRDWMLTPPEALRDWLARLEQAQARLASAERDLTIFNELHGSPTKNPDEHQETPPQKGEAHVRPSRGLRRRIF